MFEKHLIKHYWVITKGVPCLLEGVIDIPIGEGVVGDKYRVSEKMRILYLLSCDELFCVVLEL